MSVVSLTKTRNCAPSPRCIDGSAYVARPLRGNISMDYHFIPGEKGGKGGSNTAPSCHRNRVKLRVGYLGLKWVLYLFILCSLLKL